MLGELGEITNRGEEEEEEKERKNERRQYNKQLGFQIIATIQ